MQRDDASSHTTLAASPSASKQQQQQQQPKALRFVTNYGAPHPKRRRIGAACLTCRKRKTACSGERPFCETCKQNKLDCAGYSTETPSTPGHKRTASERRASEQDGDNTRKRSFSSSNGTKQDRSANGLSRTLSGAQSPRIAAESTVQSVDGSKNGDAAQDSLFSGPRNRMPYFRWLGPTAIMPGFKQMVVKVKRQDTDVARSSTNGDAVRSPSLNNLHAAEPRVPSLYSNTPAAVESDMRTPLNLPFYDTSPMPPSELITHLANTFFTHLGCNYPFLQRERFLRDLEEKQVDAILVDAVCALAARFSTHSLLTQAANEGENKSSPAEYGHAFAQRAKTALPDTYACPSVAAAQAALLLAYNEFGEQRDSGLWMYLGISIRLAQDLGLHKLEGLRYVGKDGPTPKIVKRESQSGSKSGDAVPTLSNVQKANTASRSVVDTARQSPEEQKEMDETKAVEQERVDTFWAIFFLDRVVSSGTGRRSTLRDKDIELSFPSLDSNGRSDWPPPFPALIRIVHLYGRVADLLNSIKEPSDITTDTPKRLAAMEHQVTNFYQGLSARLHFDAVNFQHYMKAGEGTNFVLLHFWFHLLIVLLHQPTLLKTFEGRMLQLFPNSQQLSMSSAKTIADILSYSQLMDAKASLGNPFTTQPIYIAACAFLKETAEQTATSNAQSRATSPSRSKDTTSDSTPTGNGTPSQTLRKASISGITSNNTSPSTKPDGAEGKKQLAKHTLLATAASQHYQLCYKALQSLETYWAGTKYILTVLDQKFEGVGDPLLYTVEEGESSMEQPRPEPAFTSPGWRRKLSWGPYGANSSMENIQSPFWPPKGFGHVPGSPKGVDPGKGAYMGAQEPPVVGTADDTYTAIGWTLTGTMNSPSTNLAWHYASGGNNTNIDPRLSSLNPSEYEAATGQVQNVQYPKHLQSGSGSATSAQRSAAHDKLSRQPTQFTPGGSAMSDGKSMHGLNSPFSQAGSAGSPSNQMTGSFPQSMHPQMHNGAGPTSVTTHMNGNVNQHYAPFADGQGGNFPMNFLPGDMMIESQDVDMSMLGLDMMPWFDSYPTHDMMGLFDPNATGGADNSGNGGAGAQQRQH